MSILIAIAAMARNRVIGREGGIPWRIADEMRWFKAATTGHTVLMGRKTWESLPKPLPNRRNLVATRGVLAPKPGFSAAAPGAESIRDLATFDPQKYGPQPAAEGMAAAGAEEVGTAAANASPAFFDAKIFVMGGAEIYAQLLPKCDELWLTELNRDAVGDMLFPVFEPLFTYEETLLIHPEFEVRRYRRNAAQARS